MSFRTRLAIRAAKICNSIIKKLNRGSGLTLPGKIAAAIDPHILEKMAAMIQKKIIVVMGTNGKTTTNAILWHTITSEGGTAVINRTGSNMMNGIISALVLATDKKGRINEEYACIEVDENASKTVLPALKPDCILLTNISRDQLDRFGEVDLTRETVKNAISSVPEALLVVNCDDVISYSLALECPNRHVTYGISEQIFDESARSEIKESIFCRKCGSKMNYEFFHYGQLGVYECPECGFKRCEPQHTADSLIRTENTESFRIDGIPMKAVLNNRYNIYNALSAYTALKEMNIENGGFADALAAFNFGNDREDRFIVNGSRIWLQLAKNPIGFQQKVSAVVQDEKEKDVIILINDNYQDGRDISWLWDVDFQYLANANAKTIYTTGSRRYDMALRLKYDGIGCKAITDLKQAIINLSKNGTGNIIIIVNYTGLYSTNHLLHELEKNGGEAAPIEEDEVLPGTAPESQNRKLVIGHLYPDLLNLYGDRGNIQCMRKRLEWRGIDSEVRRFVSGDTIDFSGLDIILLGGGSDREQELVCGYLRENKEEFVNYVENGGAVLAVCGGYQLLGDYYRTPSEKIEGLGILDIFTEWEKGRLVSDIILESSRYTMPVTGFENHGGRTFTGKNEPFGKVKYGNGNRDNDGYEGAVYKNVIATYLHGPLLPKNPEVCDDLLKRALEKKYGADYAFPELEDSAERSASAVICGRYLKKS